MNFSRNSSTICTSVSGIYLISSSEISCSSDSSAYLPSMYSFILLSKFAARTYCISLYLLSSSCSSSTLNCLTLTLARSLDTKSLPKISSKSFTVDVPLCFLGLACLEEGRNLHQASMIISLAMVKPSRFSVCFAFYLSAFKASLNCF